MQQIKWTERKFSFGYNKGYLPFLIERLQGTSPRLQELVDNCTEEEASLQHNSAWSVKQHIGHLTDLERLHSDRIDDFVAGTGMLRAADMTNAATYEADHNGESTADLLASFRAARAAFIEKLQQLDEEFFDRKAWHPRLQEKMNIPDMLYFIAEHDTHHLTRVSQLVNAAVAV